MLRKAARGFTLIELMIVVAIIGILASIAIPNFLRYQLRSKSGEAAINLGAIKTNEVAYYGSHDAYVSTTLHPAAISTGTRQDFLTATPADWDELGWKPEGTVYFQYEVVAAGANPQTFTANALANLDAAGNPQCWSFRKDTDGAGTGAQTDNANCTNAGTLSVFNQVVKTSADGEY